MARLKLPHVNAIIGRDGVVRYYFRKRGRPHVRLPGLVVAAEFMQAYSAACSTDVAPKQIGASRTKAGSVAAAIAGYFSSGDFAGLASATQRARRQILEAFRTEHGEKGIASLQRVHIERMLA